MTMTMTTRRRRLGVLAAAVGVLVIAWAAVCWSVVSRPSVDEPVRADAIVVLGDPDAGSMAETSRLVADGVSDEVVISAPDGGATLCADPPTGARVECFVPDPATTRGEAQEIGRLADQRGWDDIVVVTWTEHISRSRFLIEQCFGAGLQMVAYDQPEVSLGSVNAWIYESAAFAKAAIQGSC